MRTYAQAITNAFAVHAEYRECAASGYYEAPRRAVDTVEWASYFYGHSPSVFTYDEDVNTYYLTDRLTYRFLAVLLRVAPIGGWRCAGIPLRTAGAAALAAVVLAVVIVAYAPLPQPCGYVADSGGELLPASCESYEELAERVAALPRGDRFSN